MSKITATDLLAWSVINKETEKEDAKGQSSGPPPETLDSKWIDIILGTPDAKRMRECMDIIQNVDEDLESRITACDDFEMLIESMDNANDLESLKLWTPLLNLLSDKEAEIRMYAAWILGTSIQNNEKAKDSFLKNNGLSIMLNCLSSEMDSATRLKILYCLSGTIRNHPSIFEEFQKLNGLTILINSCQDGNPQFLRRILFLLTTLLQELDNPSVINETMNCINENRVIDMILEWLSKSDIEYDLTEQCLHLLISISSSRNDIIHPYHDRLLETLALLKNSLGNSKDSEEAIRLTQKLQEDLK